jgi:hypothetical protein
MNHIAQAVLFFVENDFEGSHGYAGRTKWIDWKAWTPCQAIRSAGTVEPDRLRSKIADRR